MTDNRVPAQNSKIFSLIRLKAECKISPVRVDFSSPNMPKLPPILMAPSFNHDHCYFTPSFLLPTDKKSCQNNTAFEKSQFEERIQRSAQENSIVDSLIVPSQVMKASPNSKYCQICQQKFEDYFNHIQLKSHLVRSTNNEVNLLIHALAQSLHQDQKQQAKQNKTKTIRKQHERLKRQKGNQTRINSHQSSRISKQTLCKGQNHSTAIAEDCLI